MEKIKIMNKQEFKVDRSGFDFSTIIKNSDDKQLNDNNSDNDNKAKLDGVNNVINQSVMRLIQTIDLETMKYDDLYKLARRLDLKKFSQLNKSKLKSLIMKYISNLELSELPVGNSVEDYKIIFQELIFSLTKVRDTINKIIGRYSEFL